MESALKNSDIKIRAELAVSIFSGEPLKILDSRFVEPKKHKALSDQYLCWFLQGDGAAWEHLGQNSDRVWCRKSPWQDRVYKGEHTSSDLEDYELRTRANDLSSSGIKDWWTTYLGPQVIVLGVWGWPGVDWRRTYSEFSDSFYIHWKWEIRRFCQGPISGLSDGDHAGSF